jgi:hypothetical protein
MKTFCCFLLAIMIILTATPVSANEPPAYIVAPDTVIYGHRPINLEVVLTNQTASPINFEVQIWIGGMAWGGENNPYAIPIGTHVSTFCNRGGCTYNWVGPIDAAGEVRFIMTTYSSTALGTYEFITVAGQIDSAPVDLIKSVTLTQGTGEPEGYIELDDYGSWLPGQLRGLKLTLLSPTLGQFIGGVFTSTCGIENLPTGFAGSYQRTYQEFLWYIFLPIGASGRCTIQGSFHQWGQSQEYSVEFNFNIPGKMYLPFVVK